MDFEILPQLVIIISVAGVLVIIGKNFSKIKELERQEDIFLKDVEEQELKEKFIYLYNRAIRRFINKENYQQKATAFWVWTEKALRKARIALLKVDSKFVAMLQNLRKKNIEAVEKIKEAEEIAQESENTELTEDFVRTDFEKKNVIEGSSEDNEIQHLEPEENFEAEAQSQIQENLAEEEYKQMREAYEESFQVEEATEEPVVEEIKAAMVESDEVGENVENVKVRTKKEQEYIDLLLKDPRDIKSYWKLGILYSKRKNYEDSLACFRQIIKIDPTYTKAKQKAIELMEKMRGHGGDEK